MNAIDAADRLALESIVSELTAAWNAGDAARFAAPFAEKSEQINIFGNLLAGRTEIAERHDRIFGTIFHGSTNVLQIDNARYVAPDVMVARVSSSVEVPHGPLQGTLQTVASVVLRKTSAGWEIVLFHNTRVAPLV
jgi:uncharacterized protein (TIGR02246 family)